MKTIAELIGDANANASQRNMYDPTGVLLFKLASALKAADTERDAALAVIADLVTTLPEVLDAAESDACATDDGIMAVDAVRAILAQATS